MSDNLLDLQVSPYGEQNGVHCLQVTGELDINTSPRLKKALDDAMDAGHNQVVLNLDGVGYIDSTGLAILVAARRRLHDKGGAVGLVCSNRHILKLLDMTGLAQLFTVYPDQAAFEQSRK